MDTSAWIALFVKNDKFHQRASRIFKSIQEARSNLYTSDYVIDETVTTIRMNSNFYQSLVAMQAIVESQMTSIIYVGPDHFIKSTQLYQKYKDQPFSFTDVSSFVLCQHIRIKKVFSFDEHFRIAGFDLF